MENGLQITVPFKGHEESIIWTVSVKTRWNEGNNENNRKLIKGGQQFRLL